MSTVPEASPTPAPKDPLLSTRRLLYLGVALGIVALDQLSKWVIVHRIPLHTGFWVIDGLFEVTHVKNTGAAFGLFAQLEHPLRAVFLNSVAFIVFLAVLVYSLKTPSGHTRLQTGLSLILGGAVGNLIDRVRLGCVTDFLNVYIGSYQWPTFNVADSAITVGVTILALDIWKKPEDGPEANRSVELSG
jgi:signal peptidase II